MPTVAQTPVTSLAFIKEVTYGSTPATPNFTSFEIDDFDGDPKPNILVDTSINPNRQLQSKPERGNEPIEGTFKTVYGYSQYDMFLESLFGSTFSSNVLKLGNTVVSLAVEDGYTDISQFRVFNGLMVNSLKLNVPNNDYCKADWGFKAKSVSALSATTADTNSAYTSPASKDKFYHNGGTFKEGGSTLGYFRDLNLEVEVASSDVFCLGSNAPYVVVPGAISVKGTATFLFLDTTLYNKFRNNTASSLEFTVNAGTGPSTHTWKIPSLAYVEGPIKRNKDSVVELNMSFTGYYNASDATTVMVTRSA